MKAPTRSSAMRQSSRAVATAEGQVKVKRKCGRPRNPIPRHKRVSHINAEHRRRGKIQNGFQMLKSLLPKYESSGRDSKADILFNAVDNIRTLLEECREQEGELQELRAEQRALGADIERHQTSLPEGQLFEEQPLTPAQRLNNLISARATDNLYFWIFGFFMKPLHKTYQETVNCDTTDTFVRSVLDWAIKNMSTASLRTVALEALRKISTKTSILTTPDLLQSEAHQHCSQAVQQSMISCTRHEQDFQHVKQEPKESSSPPPTRKSRQQHGQPQIQSEDLKLDKPFKTESIHQNCTMTIDFCKGSFESTPGYESASPTDLSPPGSSQYDSASAYSDLLDCESSVDQGYDTPSIEPADSPRYLHHLSPSSLTEQQAYDFDQFSPSPELVEACKPSTTSPAFQLTCPSDLQQPFCMDEQQAAVENSDFLDEMETHRLLDAADCHFLPDSAERHLLFTQPEQHLLDAVGDFGQPFDFSMLDYETEDLTMTLPCYTNL